MDSSFTVQGLLLLTCSLKLCSIIFIKLFFIFGKFCIGSKNLWIINLLYLCNSIFIFFKNRILTVFNFGFIIKIQRFNKEELTVPFFFCIFKGNIAVRNNVGSVLHCCIIVCLNFRNRIQQILYIKTFKLSKIYSNFLVFRIDIGGNSPGKQKNNQHASGKKKRRKRRFVFLCFCVLFFQIIRVGIINCLKAVQLIIQKEKNFLVPLIICLIYFVVIAHIPFHPSGALLLPMRSIKTSVSSGNSEFLKLLRALFQSPL